VIAQHSKPRTFKIAVSIRRICKRSEKSGRKPRWKVKNNIAFVFLKKKEREREETITMYLFFGVSRVTDIHEILHAGRILLLEFGRDPHARSS
jgi:hypothetical protein